MPPCLSCGCAKSNHSYADGRCRCGQCPVFVEKWPDAVLSKAIEEAAADGRISIGFSGAPLEK